MCNSNIVHQECIASVVIQKEIMNNLRNVGLEREGKDVGDIGSEEQLSSGKKQGWCCEGYPEETCWWCQTGVLPASTLQPGLEVPTHSANFTSTISQPNPLPNPPKVLLCNPSTVPTLKDRLRAHHREGLVHFETVELFENICIHLKHWH